MPTIAITSSKTSLKAGDTATVTFTLSEPSTDFTQSDVAVTGGTLSNFQGSGDRYTATFTATEPGPVISPSMPTATLQVLANSFSNAQGVYNAVGTNTPALRMAVTDQPTATPTPVSYTHLTLPTNREV